MVIGLNADMVMGNKHFALPHDSPYGRPRQVNFVVVFQRPSMIGGRREQLFLVQHHDAENEHLQHPLAARVVRSPLMGFAEVKLRYQFRRLCIRST